jgi:xylitol oxidase
VAERNWAGNYAYRARRWHRPSSLPELQALAARLPRWRVVGSRHSFTGIADSAEVISLDGLPADIAVAGDRRTVTVGGAVRYGDLAQALQAQGLALANLASLPHISVAGAIATATHGSGERGGNLASAVSGLELVRSDGELVRLHRGDGELPGAVVGLGALGAVTRVTLEIEPAYEVSQHVYEELSWEALLEHLDAIEAAAYSVSVFHRFGPALDTVWLKRRADRDPPAPATLFGARPATQERHPIIGLDPVHCTRQLGVPGPWLDRLPHFRMGFTPSSGEEIQSEYHLPRERAVEALSALRACSDQLAPLTQVCELRTIAADRLWLSPQYERDTLAIHFTWVADQAVVQRALHTVEDVLLGLGARPHWGKLFLAGAAELAPRYPRAGEFAALAERHDPRGALRNDWLARVLTG